MKENWNLKIELGIQSVKVREFLNKPDTSPSEGELKISYNFSLAFEADRDVLIIAVAIFYWKESSEDRLFSITVDNTFLIKDLASFQRGQSYEIPDAVVHTLLSISISHTRGLLAHYSSGTPFESLLLPIIPMDDLIKNMVW
ncbi:MAG: hypothetical protein SF052_10380 [Bacteroidia bacterium]|nr:hypothetical protein [Bacteroidia bacterium]